MPSPPASGLFDKYSQWSIGGWAHNYIASRWRISAGLFYYRKVEIGEPQQFKSNEFRLTGQANYYIKKIGYTVTARPRLEWRHIQDTEGAYENVLRLRQQFKLIVPINSKSIREKVVYSFGSDELFVKTPSDITGDDFFDRNRFEIGLGYAITRDVTVELYYANEFLPRETDQINHIINLDFNFKNLISNIKKQFASPPEAVPDE